MTTASITTKDASQHASELSKMTWPMLIGVLSLMSFQLADSYFISHLGTEPLAVVGFTIPIYQLIIGFQVGIGIATTALISQLLGAQNDHKAASLGAHILLFGSGVIIALCLTIWLFREPIILELGGTKELLLWVDEFWKIWLISAFSGAFLYFGYSICRAHGDTKLPGITMVFTSLLNIALDPLYIFTFDLGLKGAAYATLTSFLVGTAVIFPKIFGKEWLAWDHLFRGFSTSIKQISSIAAPAMLSQMLPAFSSILATALVAGYGIPAVAAWGLGIRVEFFSLILILALTMSLPPMIGKYYGAGHFREISDLVKVAIRLVLITQFVLALLLFLISAPLSEFLSSDQQVAGFLEDYLAFIPLSYGPLGVCMIVVSSANAVSQPMRALSISFIRLFVCFVPLLWIGSELGGYRGLVFGALAGNIFAGVVAWKLFLKGQKHWKS